MLRQHWIGSPQMGNFILVRSRNCDPLLSPVWVLHCLEWDYYITNQKVLNSGILNVFYQWWIIYKWIRETSEERKKAFSLRFTVCWNICKEQLNRMSTMGNLTSVWTSPISELISNTFPWKTFKTRFSMNKICFRNNSTIPEQNLKSHNAFLH